MVVWCVPANTAISTCLLLPAHGPPLDHSWPDALRHDRDLMQTEPEQFPSLQSLAPPSATVQQ
eukprot:6766282-Prorocentrum_lima.AAC.1